MNDVKMEPGVAGQVKGQMQNTYSFLIDCKSAVSGCAVLEALGFDNGRIKVINQYFDERMNELPSVFANVEGIEKSLLDLDEVGTNKLETVYDLQEEVYGDISGTEKDEGSAQKTTDASASDSETTLAYDSSDTTKGSSDDTTTEAAAGSQDQGSSVTYEDDGGSQYNTPSYDTGDGGSSYSTSTDEGSSTVTQTTTPTESTTQSVQNTEPFKFEFDTNTAFKVGDIFAGDKYSLTDFTNYILYKYGIKDEAVATKIYMSILRYGNNYYNQHQANPIKEVAEKEILSAIYKDIGSIISGSDENSFWNMLKDVKL